MLTGGFRTAEGVNAALRSGALDIVGLARLLAVDPYAPPAMLHGRDNPHRVGRKSSTRRKRLDGFSHELDDEHLEHLPHKTHACLICLATVLQPCGI